MSTLSETHTFRVPKYFAETWPSVLRNDGYVVRAIGSNYQGQLVTDIFEGDVVFDGFTAEIFSSPPQDFEWLKWRSMSHRKRKRGLYPKSYDGELYWFTVRLWDYREIQSGNYEEYRKFMGLIDYLLSLGLLKVVSDNK